MAEPEVTILEEDPSALSLAEGHEAMDDFFARVGAGSPASVELTERAFNGARVLVVDDEPAIHTIMEHILRPNNLVGCYARNGKEAMEIIRKQVPDLVITDVKMPVMDGLQLCRAIKSDSATALLPVLLLTSLQSISDKVKGFDAGADEYLPKPFHNVEIIARIRAMLRVKFLKDQLENAEQVIYSLARAVEAKDAYTAGHLERVSTFAVAIGSEFNLDSVVQAVLLKGGILHDIGKIGVPDCILTKPGKLTSEEYEQIKKHPATGEQICRSLKTLQPVLDMIRHHHERLDGSGYPDGLFANEILLHPRIMAVCDVYDALTSDRSYRQAMTDEKAITIIEQGVRIGHWDGDVVKALKSVLQKQSEYFIHADQAH